MDGGVEELHGDPTVGPRPKVWTRSQKWKWCRRWPAGEARMRDSQGGGESDLAESVCRRCVKNSPSILSFRYIILLSEDYLISLPSTQFLNAERYRAAQQINLLNVH